MSIISIFLVIWERLLTGLAAESTDDGGYKLVKAAEGSVRNLKPANVTPGAFYLVISTWSICF